MLRLVFVVVPNFLAERMVAGRIASDEVRHGYQHDEHRSKERRGASRSALLVCDQTPTRGKPAAQ